MSGAKLGGKLRAVRRRLGLTQAVFAERLGVSASYINLIESGKRTLPSELLLKVSATFAVDLREFAQAEEAQLSSELLEVFADGLFEEAISTADIAEMAQASPLAARAVVQLYRAYKLAQGTTDQLVAKLSDDEMQASFTLPSEEVSDLFQRAENYFPQLESHAEGLRRKLGSSELFPELVQHLRMEHGVQVIMQGWADDRGTLRAFDANRRILRLSELLPTRSRTFEVAHRIGLLELSDAFDKIVETPYITTAQARSLARMALGNYFAAAVLMPYEAFYQAAEECRYDVDVLGRRFRVGFEQVCHRLTTLRRPGQAGVPFHMLRVDAAGNISKRFSASGIRFARFSGACVRWNVFSAFQTPGLIRVQVSQMPDGQTFFCLARTVQRESTGYHAQTPLLAIGLGCDVAHAERLVYADAVQIRVRETVLHTPVGVTCRTCERTDCEQRAMPSIRVPFHVDESLRGRTVYAFPTGRPR